MMRSNGCRHRDCEFNRLDLVDFDHVKGVSQMAKFDNGAGGYFIFIGGIWWVQPNAQASNKYRLDAHACPSCGALLAAPEPQTKEEEGIEEVEE